MALKPLRKIVLDNIQFKCNNAADKGALVVYSATAGEVELPPATTVTTSSPSGKGVAGVLLLDVVNKAVPSLQGKLGDPVGTTDRPRNFNKLETHISGVVRLARVGMLTTDKWDHTDPSPGDKVYITNSGLFSDTQLGTGFAQVGFAETSKDSDGFVRVYLNIA